ncbi:MAG: ABC transporter ATP-binding protein [Dehalococcoidales bacterium]|nr:ABC transporter ATP-binding protein [Dehalococcoidales bacterium]
MIQVNALRKRYRRVKALDGLNMTVPDGAIYGLIGENGAGKTTTIRILATLLSPDGGEVQVAGADLLRRPHEARRLIGYMPDFFGVYDDLRVSEYLEFYAALHGIRGKAVATLRDELLELVDLSAKREEYVEHLSRGMQQRLCLARALIHDPQVILLDEPASGLDPIARVEMRELLKELGKLGKTIVISSHILSELADLCTHVGMMAAGKMIREGPVDEMVWVAGKAGYELRVLRDGERAAVALQTLEGIGAVENVDGVVRFHCANGAEDAARALATVVGAGIPVVRFGEVENTLEAAFVRMARKGVSA